MPTRLACRALPVALAVVLLAPHARTVLVPVSLASGHPASTTSTQTPDTDALVRRAADYVREYQRQLTSIVADEIYTQEIRAQQPRDRGMVTARTMKGEIFFLFTPGHDWMAIRDVVEVDGRPPHDRPDLRAALELIDAPQVAAAFKAHNARYNLGRITRNFNEPTLSLLVLDDSHRERFTFTERRIETTAGERRVVLAFAERGRNTLIRSTEGGPVPATGELTLEASTGRITRAVLAASIGPVQLTLSTTYRHDARLGLWVPERFGEHYRDGSNARGQRYEVIVGEARYSNFRRFEVETRIR